jgi:hypothetical protein
MENFDIFCDHWINFCGHLLSFKAFRYSFGHLWMYSPFW